MSEGAEAERIPLGWELRQLGDCVEFSPKIPKELLLSELVLSFVPMPKVMEVSGRIKLDETITPSEGKQRNLTYFENGDVIFAKITPCMENGKIARAEGLVNGAAFGSTEFHVLRPTEAINGDFLRLFLAHDDFRYEAERAMTGAVGQRRVPRKYLESFCFALPPLDEQEKIVEILEEQLSRLDNALASVHAAREKLARFRRSLLHAAFTGALTGHDTSDGTLPAGWLKGTVGQVADVVGGRTPTKFEQRLESSPPVNRSVPFYKVGDMNSAVRYLSESRVYFAESETGVFGIEILPSGTVIFPKAGGAIATNKKRILDVPGAIDLNCMGVTSNGELLPKLLYWFFESFNLSSVADGSVLPQIGKKKVAGIEICYPVNLVEQQKLLDDIEASISKSDEADLIAKALEKKSLALRRSLLHAAFSGNLTKEWREAADV